MGSLSALNAVSVVISLLHFVVLPTAANIDVKLNGTFLSCKTRNYRTEVPEIVRNKLTNCSRKIIIQMEIKNEGNTTTDSFFDMINTVYDPEKNMKFRLLNPLLFNITQERITLAYPFQFLSAVNGKMEEYVITSDSQAFTGCNDADPLATPCAYSAFDGNPVPFSQGFCCKCPENDTVVPLRGGQTCRTQYKREKLSIIHDEKESAHCLRQNKIWYRVSALNRPHFEHWLQVGVFYRRELPSGETEWWDMNQQGQVLIGTDAGRKVAKSKGMSFIYFGKKPSNKEITIDYSKRDLLIPELMPGASTTEMPEQIKNGARDFLLVPKEMIHLDGAQCDSVGVSYNAFYHQQDKCFVPKDTCLRNQPLDLWEEDDIKRNRGMRGQYLLENFARPFKCGEYLNTSSNVHSLRVEYDGTHYSYLWAEINAENITVLRPGFAASIPFISSETWNDISQVSVHVMNGGLVSARFDVTILNCDQEGIKFDENEVSVVISPRRTHHLSFRASLDIGIRRSATCKVSVHTEKAGILAQRDVLVGIDKRCLCYMYCQCTCFLERPLCHKMKLNRYRSVGFLGPGLTLRDILAKNARNLQPSSTLIILLIVVILLVGVLLTGLSFQAYQKRCQPK